MMLGKFITIEGGDGSGKSTLIRHLSAWMKEHDIPCVLTREPGGTPGGEEIRSLVLKGQAVRWDALSETLLMFAARRDLVVNFVRPHLTQGVSIICDRFVDSSLVYQGYAGGVSIDWIQELYNTISEGIYPDLTLVLDVDPKIGLRRTQERPDNSDESRFESKSFAYHQRIREGFLMLAQNDSHRYAVIDANLPAEEVFKKACFYVQQRCFPDLAHASS